MSKIAWFLSGAVTSGIICSLAFAFSNREGAGHSDEAGGSASGGGGDRQVAVGSPSASKAGERPAGGDRKKLSDPVRALEDMARTSPELLSRLNLRLFDENLNPIPQNWAILGVEQSEIDALHQRLQKVGEKLKEEELKNFDVAESSDESVRLVLRPLSEDAVRQLTGQFDEAFQATFSPELAKALSSNFIASPSPAVAALKRLNRIATVRMTSEDLYQQTGKKYTLDIRTISEHTKVPDALGNLDRYSVSKTDFLLDEIPASWSHLFQTK